MTIYYETLSSAVDGALNENVKTFTANENWRDGVDFEPMSYETYQSKHIPGVLAKGRKIGKPTSLYVTIYRMPSGRYEVTAYTTG